MRVVAQRSRALTTKNGKVGSASDAESVGMSVRVIADGAWGFAASAELGRGAVEATAAQASRSPALGTGQAGRCAPGAGEAGGRGVEHALQDRSVTFRWNKILNCC